MALQAIGILFGLVAITFSNPCLDLQQDKNDGLKVFRPPNGIASNAFSLLAKRNAYEVLNKPKRSVDGIFVPISDNLLYSDDNDLISNLKNRVFLPLYVFRSKRLMVKSRKAREAVVECPSEEGVSSPTYGDFYAKKPSDIKTADVPSQEKSGNEKSDASRNPETSEASKMPEKFLDQNEEDMKTAESTIVFRPLFAFRQKKNYRRGYRRFRP